MKRIFKLWKLGIVSYAEGLKVQERALDIIKRDEKILGILILLQHNPVYTVGIRKYKDGNIPAKDTIYTVNKKFLMEQGAEYYETNRGGLITFHGPGQLIAYPILNLRSVFSPPYLDRLTSNYQDSETISQANQTSLNFIRIHVNNLIYSMTLTCRDLQTPYIYSKVTPSSLTGSWYIPEVKQLITPNSQMTVKTNFDSLLLTTDSKPVECLNETFIALSPQKVGALGVRFANFYTSHGVALNCNVNLKWYRYIDPCGLSQHLQTSSLLSENKNNLKSEFESTKQDCLTKINNSLQQTNRFDSPKNGRQNLEDSLVVTSITDILRKNITVDMTIPYFIQNFAKLYDVHEFVED